MKKTTFTLLTVMLLIGTFYSCQKEDKQPPKSELLTRDLWIGTTANLLVNGFSSGQTQDISTLKLEFKSDGSAKLYDGKALKGTGQWSLTDNDSKLIISLDGNINLGDILTNLNSISVDTLTETELVLSGSQKVNYQSFEADITIKANFKH